MNPPYGKEIGLWMEKAYKSSLLGATVACLVPTRTDTRWWQRWAQRGEVRLLPGRVRVAHPGGNAAAAVPFPSAVVVFHSRRLEVDLFESDESTARRI